MPPPGGPRGCPLGLPQIRTCPTKLTCRRGTSELHVWESLRAPPVRCSGWFGAGTGGVPQNDHSLAEPSLLDQLKVQPHTIWEEAFSAADDHREYDHLKFVNKTGS